MVNLSQFTDAASKGYGTISLSSKDGKIRTHGNGIFGKIASFFHSKIKPSRRKYNENSAALGSFIQAIASDSNYGPEYARMANKNLLELSASSTDKSKFPKTLTCEDVSFIMKAIDTEKEKEKKIANRKDEIAKINKNSQTNGEDNRVKLSNSLQSEIRNDIEDISSLKETESVFCGAFIPDANRNIMKSIGGEPTNASNWRDQMTKLFTDENGNFNDELCLAASKIMQQGTFATICKEVFPLIISIMDQGFYQLNHGFEISKNNDGNYSIKLNCSFVAGSSKIGRSSEAMLKAGMPIYSASAEIILPASGNSDETMVKSFSHELVVSCFASDQAKRLTDEFVNEYPIRMTTDYPKP
ncbi:MAG: hypothetical protein LBH49_01915 [Puniceicoccales bacterium]|jgi:hypothetical protein|nr:hypothetical protein [Puniceicoccales bacterium]